MNLTPLVDVIFILLLFFMISTQFRKAVLPMDLPKAGSTVQEDRRNRTLTVDRNERITLDGIPLSLPELGETLISERCNDIESGITLACDASVDFGVVVRILDELNNAGVGNVSIRHDPIRD